MSLITRTQDARTDRTPIGTTQLGFTLSFAAGKGLLTTRDLKLGPFDIKVLELEIPHIKFPFDVTGGAEKFKTRRCELKHLTVALSGEAIAELIQATDASAHGFYELKTAMRDGHIELAGRLQGGEVSADFTMRAALLPRALDELAIVFYDTRVYGALPIPSALIPTLLRRALDLPFLASTPGGERASTWIVKPAEQFVRNIMPQLGWKVPDVSKVAIAEAQLNRGQLIVAIGPQGEPSQRQMLEHTPPPEAAQVHEGASLFDEAELLLSQGQVMESYELYRAALDDDRGGKFVRDRLLQIGASIPDLALETKSLADEILAKAPNDIQSLLAMGAIALRDRAFGEAASRFDKLTEQSRDGKDRFDSVAGELASAAAAAPIDRDAAIAAYERAASRARDSVVAYRALFELRSAAGEWDKAAKAGDRLTRLEREPKRRAAIYKQLGHLARSHLNDLKKARVYFERALKLAADDPESLEGLAETYAARGEPGRAASYLARLAEQAEQSGDLNRIVTLNLRLGEIWEKWLGDTESAAARYMRVLDAKPRDRVARLRLAELAERTGDVPKARLMLEEIVALEDEATDPTLRREIALAYTRLARIVINGEGQTDEAVTSLERAVELDPNLREARDQLAIILRERSEWQKLVDLLEAAARVTDDKGEAKRARIEAARLELGKRNDSVAAQRFLEDVLDDQPDDAETLDLLLPLLREANDYAGIMERVTHAAEATLEPVRRAQYLLDLARARDALGMDPESRRRALEDALDVNPYLLEAAETLVQLLEDYDDYERLVRALGRLAVATTSPDARADALLRQGRLLWQQLKRPGDAEEALREAVRLEPGNFATWTALSRLLESIGKIDEARDVMTLSIQEAERRSVNRGPLHERLAELARTRDDAEDEARELLLAVESGVRGQKISDRLVQVLANLGRIKEAATLLEDWASEENAVRRDAEMWLFKAAELRRSLGETERASDIYRGLLDSRGDAALPSARALEKIAESRSDWDTVATTLAYQLDVDKGEQQAALLTRMANAQAQRQDWLQLESFSEKLVALDPRSVPGHWHLAQCLLRVENFHEALFNVQMLVLEGTRDPQYTAMRKSAYVLAAALALEIDESILPELHKAFADEFVDDPPTTLTTPFGALLAHAGEWNRLLALRRTQLERATDARATPLRREIATILHERLGRSDSAIPFYQDVIASEPDDMRSRDALVEVFEKLGRWGDLANTLFALSQLVSDTTQAIEYGLRGVTVFADKLHDYETGAQVLRTLIGATGLDPDNVQLVLLLRKLDMHAELAHVLSMSLEKTPSAVDGRLDELVEIIEGPLAQADAALEWAQRYVTLFPDVDEPRVLVADLMQRHEGLGDLRAWLERWAKDRDGKDRAPVLGRLAEYLRSQGKDSDALTVLEAAAQYDPANAALLQRLVDRTTAAGDWQRATHWLEQLAFSVDEDVTLRDLHLRKLIEVATDYADDAHVAIRALQALSQRDALEEQHLAELWIDTAHVPGIQRSLAIVRNLSTKQLLTAARHLAGAQDHATSRELIDVAIARGDDVVAWALADELWTMPSARVELANWRLQAAGRESRVNVAAALRVEAYTTLIAANETVDDDDVRAAFDGVDLTDERITWGAFQLSRAIQDSRWEARAAAALDALLPPGDARLPEVVHARARIALGDDQAAEAVSHARKLVDLGDPRGERLLDDALERSGDVDGLVATLSERAEAKSSHDAASLWTRIARIEIDRQDSAAALIALERVHEDERDLGWGRLMYDVATSLDDVPRRFASARTIARFTSDEEQRADWLRTAARLAWWELGNEDDGRDALKEAQHVAPESPQLALDRANASIEAGSARQARRDLLEALAVHAGEATVGLWLRLADVEEAAGARDEATRALERATQIAPDDARLLASIGERAERVMANELALAAFAKAMRLDGAYEDTYLAALMRARNWDKAVVVLEGRAEELGGVEAARRYVAASDLAVDQLDDAPRALAFLEKAADLDGSEDSLRKALRLAKKLGRATSIVELAARLDQPGASDGAELARDRVTALDELGRTDETIDLRERLVTAELASTDDRLMLSRLLEAEAPGRAARHLRAAAMEPELAEQPDLLVKAALLFKSVDELGEARPLVNEALERGVDTTETHALAVELLSGEMRLRSLARLIAENGDGGWDDEKRATARVELGEWYVGQGALEEARLALVDAARFGKPKGWVHALEAVLQQQGRELELAQLWLDEAVTDVWPDLERNARVQRAATIYRDAGDDAGEYRALELLSRFTPDDEALRERLMEVVATLGDVDDFVRRVEQQLAAATGPGARAEVVMRYANVLDERFERGDRAIELTLAAFDELPSLELARLAQKLMTRHGRAKELAIVLHARAMTLPSPDDRSLLSLAADIARDADDAIMFAITRELHTRYPDDEAARDFVIGYATDHAKYDELVPILRTSADAAPDAEQAFDFLLRAADTARDHLHDEALEVTLLDNALGAMPGNTIVTERLFDLRVKRIELDLALGILQGEGWESSDEMQAGFKLVEAFRAVGSTDEADKLSQWLAIRHPDTAFAADVRLAKARAENDRASILREVEARLANAHALKGNEWLTLHGEAGEAAVALGELQVALRHFISAIDTPEPATDALRRAHQLAYELGDDNRAVFVVQSAANVREQILTRATSSKGQERLDWLYLLGQAHEAASDPTPAIEAYRQTISAASGPVHERAFEALEHLYRKRGEWQLVAEMHDERAKRADNPSDRADSLYRKAQIWKEYLFDEEGAETALEEALSFDADHPGAQLELGLLAYARRKYERALPLLQRQLEARGDDAPIDHWVALLDALNQTGNDEEALSVATRVLQRDPMRIDVRIARAELLEKLGHADDAADEWHRYLETVKTDVDADMVASVHERLARHALRHLDRRQAMAHYEAAYQLTPESVVIIRGMRALHEADGNFADAAALRTRELALAATPAEQLEQHLALARTYGEQLQDPARAAKHLEKAYELNPTDIDLGRELFAVYDAAGEGQKLTLVGERLLSSAGDAVLDAAFYGRLARAYEEVVGDVERAKTLIAKAVEVAPQSRELRETYLRLALATGDYATWAPLEEQVIEQIPEVTQRARRYQALADIVGRELKTPAKAAALMLRARELDPSDATMTRRLADTYALDAASYAQAAELYRTLLDADPLNMDLLKILARLSGQIGDTDRAYGYYAALLVLAPSDAEGKRFVSACRNAMPPGPQRAVTDADRQQGLVHPDQLGLVEDLFAPLARFAELTQPGNLKLRGVDERDLLAPTDERVKWVTRVLEPLGVPQVALYLWRGGGFACEAELVGSPTILLGSTLASDASQRQRAFLVARTAELYRSGHTLCERLSPIELEALLAALAIALTPGSTAPGSGPSTSAWANIISQPMTEQIRTALRDRAKTYIGRYADADLPKWRRACLATAGRVALLLSCDVEDAIAAVLRLRGFDDVSDDQRASVLLESPEALDLFRFALSDSFFKLREALGMALRRAK